MKSKSVVVTGRGKEAEVMNFKGLRMAFLARINPIEEMALKKKMKEGLRKLRLQ